MGLYKIILENEIDADWIRRRLEINKLSQRSLADYLLTNEQTISRWLSGKQNLSGANKAALYYYFRCLELESELKK
jgi:transcriptional regulator with XRE-family HTH domain